MYISPHNSSSSSLELTIAMPGFSSSGENGGHAIVRECLDINQVPSFGGSEEEGCINEDEIPNSPAPRKKLRLTGQQSLLLEQNFRQNHILNPNQKAALASDLKLKPRQVEVWFQNRRARSKLKQTEIECEYLKRWLGSLKEQNRRLRQEVEKLRAIKVGRPGPSHDLLHCSSLESSLTMCPGCERVTTMTASTTTDMSTAANETFVPPRQSAIFHN